MTHRIHSFAVIAITLLAGAAAAQTSDEARQEASERTAQQRHQAEFAMTEPEPVAAGDYQAEARNRTREHKYRAMMAAVRAYGNGVRVQPDVGLFTDALQAESRRQRSERQIARLHELLQSSPQARADADRGSYATPHIASR